MNYNAATSPRRVVRQTDSDSERRFGPFLKLASENELGSARALS